MKIPVIAFFNTKGGVGKTTLLYHLAHMFSDMRLRVLAADLDPQANLTVSFLDEPSVEKLWDAPPESRETIFGAIYPVAMATGNVRLPKLPIRHSNLALLPGDLALASVEDTFGEAWSKLQNTQNLDEAFKVTSAIGQILQSEAELHRADLIVCDLAPGASALSRAALVAADHLVVPVGPDLTSVDSLRNLGPLLRRWKTQWREGLRHLAPNCADPRWEMPNASINILGYVVNRHPVWHHQPTSGSRNWINRIPKAYREYILEEPARDTLITGEDSHCLAVLKDYRSLALMAQEHHKPMFHLTIADGAIGAHQKAVQQCREDFQDLAQKILKRTNLEWPG